MRFFIKFHLIFIISLSISLLCLEQVLAHDFIRTILVYYASKIKLDDINKLAKYDVVVLNRFNYDDVVGGTWNILKKRNPKLQIFVYQDGPEVADNHDTFQSIALNDIARYQNARNHSMGALHFHSYMFLLDDQGRRINNKNFKNFWLLDFGSNVFQKYWLEATKQDILMMEWCGDGIFIDNCACASEVWKNNPFGGPFPSKYPNAVTWNNAMNDFVAFVTNELHKSGVKVFPNRGNSRSKAGYDAWLQLDRSNDPPDILMEEGAFAVKWGKSDVQFYSEEEWKRQIKLAQKIKKSRIAWLAHTDLTINGRGKDNYGNSVSFWQILWYALCSYHVAKSDMYPPYFMFYGVPNKKIWWFDEYDKIDLGRALGSYNIKKVSGTNIYWREFEKGYVYVNPTPKNAFNITLPEKCGQLSHDTLDLDAKDLPQKRMFDLPAHHGTIFLKIKQNNKTVTTPVDGNDDDTPLLPPRRLTITANGLK